MNKLIVSALLAGLAVATAMPAFAEDGLQEPGA